MEAISNNPNHDHRIHTIINSDNNTDLYNNPTNNPTNNPINSLIEDPTLMHQTATPIDTPLRSRLT
jgi:hypothetical protein